MNSRVNARVVATVDGQLDRTPDPYVMPCLRQARQKCQKRLPCRKIIDLDESSGFSETLKKFR